jgi:hypothetical protein
LNAGEWEEYEWSTGNTTPAITVTESGTYSVTVTGDAACTNTATTEVAIGSTLGAEMNSENESVCGAEDGSASVIPSGGTAPYEILWSNSETTASINGLTAGEYSVTVTDANGCTFTEDVELQCVIVGINPLENSMVNVYPNPNPGKLNVEFQVEERDDIWVTVSNPAGKLIYQESLKSFSGEYRKTVDLQNSGKGMYLVRVRDSRGEWVKKVVVQ